MNESGNCHQNATTILASLGRTRSETLAAGAHLFRQGDPVTSIFRVESGCVRLERTTATGAMVVLHTASAGETLAEAALFSDVYHCNAVALKAARVCVYDKRAILAALKPGSMALPCCPSWRASSSGPPAAGVAQHAFSQGTRDAVSRPDGGSKRRIRSHRCISGYRRGTWTDPRSLLSRPGGAPERPAHQEAGAFYSDRWPGKVKAKRCGLPPTGARGQPGFRDGSLRILTSPAWPLRPCRPGNGRASGRRVRSGP